MQVIDDTEARARRLQRDIERTREEMDQTLSALEHRLAPAEIVHRGAEELRGRLRAAVASTIETLEDNPGALAIASALVGGWLAFRPSATERRARQTEEDLDRTWAVLVEAAVRMRRRSEVSAGLLADRARQGVRRALTESQAMSRAIGRDAGAHPLGAIVLLGALAGATAIGMRRGRS